MKLARFKNIPAVINLTWHALPADQSERSAVKATLEQNKGVKAGVVVKYGGVTLLGLGPPNVKVIGGPSAAAWLAMANQKAMDQGNASAGMPSTGSGSTNDWIVVENLGDGSFWLAIIRDGVPLPGTDIVLDREVTLDLIREAVETAPFIVFSPDEGIRGDVPAGTIVESKGFADLVQGHKPGKAAMRAISGAPVKLLGGIAVVILLGLIWFAYSWWSEKKAQEDLMRQQALQSAEQQKQMAADKSAYALQVRQAVIAALEKGESDLNISLANPSPNDAIATWVGMIADTSPNQNGWNITSFECGLADGPPSCKVNLARGEYGINRVLLKDHPDAVLEGDGASFVISGPILGKREMKFQQLERSDSFNLEFISDLQMLHFASLSYSIAESADVTSPIAMPAIPASIFKPGDTAAAPPAPGPVKMGVATGALTFSGTELWQLEGLREFLRRENISVQTVSVAMGDVTPGAWTLNGIYYIKNAPEPVLPIVLGPDQEMIQATLPDRFKASPEELSSWTSSAAVPAAASTAPAAATSPSGAAPETPDATAPAVGTPAPPPPENPPAPAGP